MSVDYYKLFQVQRNARHVRKAAEAKLNLINEAYEVLSDPRKRVVYDQQGDEGLRRGAAQPFHSPWSGDMNGRCPDPLTQFFWAGTGMARVTSWVMESVKPEEIFSTFLVGGTIGENRFQWFECKDSGHRNGPRKAAAIERTLPCTLEELDKGATKKLKISRDVLGASARKSTVEEVLTIDIKLGWKKGMKITFLEKSHDTWRGAILVDIVFIVNEKPHGVYRRDGDDLIVTQKISLAEALMGHTAQLTALDGRNLSVSIDSIISQTHEEVVRGEGMPIQKERSKKGNLIVKFSVKFPKLTPEQKTGIRMLLMLKRTTTVEEILTIEIKPGWKKGTKITFPEKGNEQRGIIPADLVFIIDEKPHTLFKRDGNDLTITQKISLAEALTGYTAQLTTLDGRNLPVSITNIVSPAYEEVVKGEGMPIPKEPSKRGNLRIKFNIKFPTKLTSDQKSNIKRLLTS